MRIIYFCLALLPFAFTLVFCPFAPADSEISWNTFLGSGDIDESIHIAADAGGNLYVTGRSDTSWGSPINAHSGGRDAFVAKLDSSGVLQWHTFLGSSGSDFGNSVAVDASGNLYVIGYSDNTWGSPINVHAGSYDAFVAKLDSTGVLQWHTFLGSVSTDSARSVVADQSGNLYVTGYSDNTWGSPISAHAGGDDAFVAKLDSTGVLQWHTFLGSVGSDQSSCVAAGFDGHLFVAGDSDTTWGSPINAHSGGFDAFVAKLDSSGVLRWHTFLGSSDSEFGLSIATVASGNLYVTGRRDDTLGSHAFVAKLDSNGLPQWHTLLGSGSADAAGSVTVDASSNLYVTGHSDATWGSPIKAHSGGFDAFVAKLDSSGVMQWHTFLGSGGSDFSLSVATVVSGNLYLTGSSDTGWGSPVNSHAGDLDAFVAKIHDLDTDDDGCPNDADGCPYDLYKCDPGACGCGTLDTDTDSDSTPDCIDNCPNDPNKIQPGICGCGVADTDTDTDGIPDCIDTDDDGDGVDDGVDAFPTNANETTDTDQDGNGDNADSDDDNDGTEDALEMAGPANGDGNGDGIADSLQNHVTTLPVQDGQQFCTLELAAGHRFTQSQAVDTPPAGDSPDGVDFDYGYFDFTAAGIGMGQNTTVTLYLPAGAAPTTYYKYGKTPDNPADHWYEFLYDGQTGAEINGNVVILHFVDGQRGDDVLATDGMVIDVGGPGFESIATNTSGSGGGGCFIDCLVR